MNVFKTAKNAFGKYVSALSVSSPVINWDKSPIILNGRSNVLVQGFTEHTSKHGKSLKPFLKYKFEIWNYEDSSIVECYTV
jgi:hypothetical protein